MPFIEEILKHKSLSIVGMEKNTGKTECLNYILGRIKGTDKKIAVTSAGVDGESIDAVKHSKKPEIELNEDTVFITSETHYYQKKLTSEILDVSTKKTALGRLITAKSLSSGKIIFSGPSDTLWLRSYIDKMQEYNVKTTIVDGALSRMSMASPAITECMILTTGAALSSTMPVVIKKTKFVYDLIKIPVYDQVLNEDIFQKKDGIWAIDPAGNLTKLCISSTFNLNERENEFLNYHNTFYFAGMVSNTMLNFLKSQKNISETTIIVQDFTRLFISPEALNDYKSKGGKIFVLFATKLLAVCINPFSPEGYHLNSHTLLSGLSSELNIPVYDIKNLQI